MTGRAPRRAPRGLRRAWLAFAALVATAGCGGDGPAQPAGASRPDAAAGLAPDAPAWAAGADDPHPPTERRQLVDDLRARRDQPRHVSDGGGVLRLDLPAGDDGSVRAGGARSWSLVYEAGPHGIAAGGALVFQAPAFWGWSPPQIETPAAPGFTRITSEAEGVRLDVRRIDELVVSARVLGRALAEGERLRIEYGGGPAGARADRFAERASRFLCEVDGDGDGARSLLAGAPSIVVLPGPPAQLVLSLAGSARPGGALRLTAAVLDAFGNAGCDVEGEVLLALPPGLEGPSRLELRAGGGGAASLELRAAAAGLHRVAGEAPGGLLALSNPVHVDESAPRILWCDLHGHSGLSDGTGTPEDFYRYARDVAGLDAAALTDHDHWGMPFLDETPAMWERIGAAAAAHHAPGRFVSLLAYEWTSWIHGHRHVLHFADEGPLLSSLDERYETPRQLWDALDGRPAMTFAHHTGGGPIATNWSFAPDPVLEPVVEVSSVHGSSEALDSPGRIYAPVPGRFARDALAQGYRLGFVGSGDGHDGHPGLAHLADPRGQGGLAAVFAEDCTREAVLEALRARRCYATSGPRIVLRATLGGRPMGGEVPPGDADLVVLAAGAGALDRIEVVRGAGVVASRGAGGAHDALESFELSALEPGEFVYVRVVQVDGGLAWSSPFFVAP